MVKGYAPQMGDMKALFEKVKFFAVTPDRRRLRVRNV